MSQNCQKALILLLLIRSHLLVIKSLYLSLSSEGDHKTQKRNESRLFFKSLLGSQ